MYGILLKAPQFKWIPENKGLPYPYICVSNCEIGYTWQRETKKCVKIVKNSNAKTTYPLAAVQCAAENARLLSINTCNEMQGIQNDLWTKYPGTHERYWVGYYAEGFSLYTEQKRVQMDSGRFIAANGLTGALADPSSTVYDSEDACDGNEPLISMVDSAGQPMGTISPGPDGYFSQLVFTDKQKANLMLHAYHKDNQTTAKDNYLCEKDNYWACPEDYLLFQEVCYKIHEKEVTLAKADEICKLDGGKVIEIQTRMHQSFINGMLDSVINSSISKTWVGYKRKTNSLTEMSYKPLSSDANTQGFDFENGLDFTEAHHAANEGDDCVLMEYRSDSGFVNGWKKVSCFDEASVICQRSQIVNDKVLGTLPIPEVMIPFDASIGFSDYNKNTRETVAKLVAITNEGNRKSNLLGSAHFLGKPSSYIEIVGKGNGKDEIFVNFGLSVLLWIKIDKINRGEKQVLIDASGICETGAEKDHSFILFLEKSFSSSEQIDQGTTCADLLLGKTTATLTPARGVQEMITLNAILCDGPALGGGSCKQFRSTESMPILEQEWTFVGFTFDKIEKKGTFIVNDIFGYTDIDTGAYEESKYFTYDTKNWLITDAVIGPLRIGSRKFQHPTTGVENFAGQMSCLQLYEGSLAPSLADHLKSCPVVEEHHGKFKLCPPGFEFIKDNCFLLETKTMEFASAEYDCVSRSTSNYTVRLGFTSDMRVLEYMAQFASKTFVSEFWFGLDGRSDLDLAEPVVDGSWVSSYGDVINVNAIRWEGEGPQNDTSLQCAAVTTENRTITNKDCTEKLPYVCLTPSLDQQETQQCPKGFVPYKKACYARGRELTDYDGAEKNCAFNGSRVLAIRDRATYQFIRAFSVANKLLDIYLGINYTTGDPDNPSIYSDGTPFDKDTGYAFDGEREKFGSKNCTYLKKGVTYKPRDTDCTVMMDHICQWNSKTLLV